MEQETQHELNLSRVQNRSSDLAVLSESSVLRYVTFSLLYMAQGLPPGLMNVAFPAWLAQQGLGATEIGGFMAIVTLPWSLKFIFGPMMDRFGFLPMGRRRPWVLVAQFGILISFALMMVVSDPVKNLDHVTFIGVFVCMFVALQDVAVDGMAIDVIPIKERARANGFMWGSKILGIAIAASGGGILLGAKGFQTAILIVTALLGLIALFPLLLRERKGERILPWTQGTPSEVAIQLQLHDWNSIFRGLLRTLLMPISLLTILLAFSLLLGFGLLKAMLPVFSVQELGWNHTDYSHLFAVSGIIACVVGMLLSATIINTWGVIRTLLRVIILLIFLEIMAGIFSNFLSIRAVFVSFIICVIVLEFSVIVTFLAMFMNMCWKRIAATQFALYMALISLGSSAGAALTGPLTNVFSYTHIFFVMAAGSMLVLLLLRFINLKEHQEHVNRFEV